MGLLDSIVKIFRQKPVSDSQNSNKNNTGDTQVRSATNNTVTGLDLSPLDGMGTATAKYIINRHVDQDTCEKFGVKDLKNMGRYYTAKIVEPDGTIVDELLVDKLNGTVNSLHKTFVDDHAS